MSYSFKVRAGSKAEAQQAISDELQKVIANSPEHANDCAHAAGYANALVNFLGDDSAKEIEATLSGSCHGGSEAAPTYLQTSIEVALVDREQAKEQPQDQPHS